VLPMKAGSVSGVQSFEGSLIRQIPSLRDVDDPDVTLGRVVAT